VRVFEHRLQKLSPSASQGLPLSRKLSENSQLFREYVRVVRGNSHFDDILADITEYDVLLERYSGLRLSNARILEIGFGARPYRQLVLHSMGMDCGGVDAEVPVLRGYPSEFYAMARRNGAERAAKSLVRYLMFDTKLTSRLRSELDRRGLVPQLDHSRLIVSDVAKLSVTPSSLDLVFSEDVFEHIRRDTLMHVVPRIASWLGPRGLALIRPNVFTGIIGGHLVEWSVGSMRHAPRRRRSEPWEHLRKRRFQPNTELNEMTRAEYRQLFQSSFDILEERVRWPHLGREYLSEEARRDLALWSDDELFSNQTLFVLRPRLDCERA
jgi:hypothetical protein